MTDIEYGKKNRFGSIIWLDSETDAREQCVNDVWMLVAREVGEPYKVQTLPNTPGSVILHPTWGFLVLDIANAHVESGSSEACVWGSATTCTTNSHLAKEIWSIHYDAAREALS